MIYEPREDSFLLEKYVRIFAKDKSVIDIGTGSGIQALAAKEAGAKSVLAVDISGDAVKEVQDKGIRAIISDLFSNVEGKFDLIICNPPYLPQDSREDDESALITSGGKKGDEFICRLLRGGRVHLSRNGMILIIISSLTPQDEIKNVLAELKMKREVLGKEDLPFEKLYAWKICF